MSRVLVRLRGLLSERGLSSLLPGTDFDCGDVSFVDDLAVPVVAGAASIIDKTLVVTKCVYDAFGCFGFSVNFRPGKSEAVDCFSRASIPRVPQASL